MANAFTVTCFSVSCRFKQGRIHGNPVAESWAGAVPQKLLRIYKCDGRTDGPMDGPTDTARCSPNSGPERSDFRSGRPDLRPGKPNLGPERSDLVSVRGNEKHRKIALCGIIGCLPLCGPCPERVILSLRRQF